VYPPRFKAGIINGFINLDKYLDNGTNTSRVYLQSDLN